jgi:hypothetical protein
MSDARVIAHVTGGGSPAQPTPEQCRGYVLPDSLWALLKQCWSLAPEMRPSVHVLVDLLEKLCPNFTPSDPARNVTVSISFFECTTHNALKNRSVKE